MQEDPMLPAPAPAPHPQHFLVSFLPRTVFHTWAIAALVAGEREAETIEQWLSDAGVSEPCGRQITIQ